MVVYHVRLVSCHGGLQRTTVGTLVPNSAVKVPFLMYDSVGVDGRIRYVGTSDELDFL